MARGEGSPLEKHGYSLGTYLGSGAYGKVMKATYKRKSGKLDVLACKTIDTTKLPSHYSKKFLPRELEVIRWLNHPGLVRTHSIIYRRGTVYIFMEFAEKGTLLNYLRQNTKLSEAKCQVWFRQVLGGMLYLHRFKYAHRDMKCDNILITRHYNLKVCDFGFARLVVDADGKYELSRTFCGTPSYCPPEILEGKPYYPLLADAWSTGVTLFVIMCQSMPFSSRDTRTMLQQQKSQQWRFNTFVTNNFSDEAKDVVRSLLVPSAQKRVSLFKVARHKWCTASTTTQLVGSTFGNK